MHSRVTPSSDGAFVGGRKVDDLTLVHSCTNADVRILKVQTEAVASSENAKRKTKSCLLQEDLHLCTISRRRLFQV